MKAVVCVYRHPIISRILLHEVQQNALKNPLLGSFLEHYFRPCSYYDWGDDPSFFQATYELSDPKLASWGVCRWEVRKQLGPGDLIVFICGCEGPERRSWKYFYVGYGTVRVSLQREEVFLNDEYVTYRSFFNMISRWEDERIIQDEIFGEKHGHFEQRCRAGYILFDPKETDFNLSNPLPIARYDRGDPSERWYNDEPLVAKLKSALFLDGTIDRQLNSGTIGHSHVYIPVHTHLKNANRLAELPTLRPNLAEISVEIRNRR